MTTKTLESLTENDEDKPDTRPKPNDFFAFLPWACSQFQLESAIVITKVYQSEYVSATQAEKNKKTRALKQHQNVLRNGDLSTSLGNEGSLHHISSAYKTMKILAYCDPYGNLVELKFDKNIHISCLIFKIMALIVKYQVFLTRITINSGLDQHSIYEINKFLVISNITELCLDNSVIAEANYDILFEDNSKIRYLSLARCKINDVVIENVAKKLVYPLPASKCLTCLILTSNRITDKGVQSFGKALRSNRQLSYISLADNSLTDEGLMHILDILVEFPLRKDEILDERSRYMQYLQDKNVMISNVIKELRSGEYDKRITRRKTIRPVSALPLKKGKLEKEGSLKSVSESRSYPNLDYLFYDKAASMVGERLGEFSDPFSSQNTSTRKGAIYCHGNNAVANLNLAYNNLSYISIKKLLSVLMYQKLHDRKPRGLINVCVEGNNIPVSCKELGQIDDILEAGLTSRDRRGSISKKRPMSKHNTPR